MEFINVRRLEKELKDRLKVDCFNVQGYLHDIENYIYYQGLDDGLHYYELSKFETKSGHEELIPFELFSKYIYNGEEYLFDELPIDGDGDVLFDTVLTKVVF